MGSMNKVQAFEAGKVAGRVQAAGEAALGMDSSQAFDHHAENDKIHAQESGPPVIDYSHVIANGTGLFSMNARELGQRIVGEVAGRSLHNENIFHVVVPRDLLAGVVVALVDSGWTVRQVSWNTPVADTIEVRID